MKSEPPQASDAYRDWYSVEHGFDSARDSAHYDIASQLIRDAFTASSFWERLRDLLPEYADEYEVATGYPLFVVDPRVAAEARPRLGVKPFSSLVEKTWRKNALDNARWPKPPVGGWITPSNWYERVGDLVRTSVAVKYLDGVTFVAQRLVQRANAEGMPSQSELAARHDGYYAAHVDVGLPVDLGAQGWESVRVKARVELQITTQLQEVIRRLLHRQYESERVKRSTDDWEWDYRSDAFRVKYLGHVLHYIEGRIMDERERAVDGVE